MSLALIFAVFSAFTSPDGEVAALNVNDFKIKRGEMTFYRPKVDKEQTAFTWWQAFNINTNHCPVPNMI